MDLTAHSLGGYECSAFCGGGSESDDSDRTPRWLCSACRDQGWFPCLECLDTPGEVRRNCSSCDVDHTCICGNCLGQGFPAGKVPCGRCLSRGRRMDDVSGVIRVDGTCIVCDGPCRGH